MQRYLPAHLLIIQACFILFFFLSVSAKAQQVSGCTDPLANNYNAAANYNNGTCTYNTSAYTPPPKVDPLSDTLVESSGLQWAGGYLWSFNDGGGLPVLYRIDTITNTILQRVYLQGATNIDWEDIACDERYFYIGDFGNNENGARTNLVIYKFPVNVIPNYVNNPVATVSSDQIESIPFTYQNQPQPPQPVATNTTSFDCEAMLVDAGKIHLFTKDWASLRTVHYIINGLGAGTYTAMPVDTLQTNFLVTAADKAVGRNTIALLGYQNTGTAAHFLYVLNGYNGDRYFNGNKHRIDLPDVLTMGQAEGITFRNATYGYISNERFVRTVGPITITIPQRLRSFDLSSFIYDRSYNFIGNGAWSNAANWSNNQVPPTLLPAETTININPMTGGKCVLDIPYTLPVGVLLSVKTGKVFELSGNLMIHR